MIVDEPRVTLTDDEVTITATVTLEEATRPSDGGRGYPPALYFAFPRAWAEFVVRRTDAFAAALLPLAMRRGEPLRLRGEVSCRLADGLRDYQRVQAVWKPAFFAPVDLECAHVISLRRDDSAGAVASAFSGGVDSFHTLWSHLPANERFAPYAVTHCLTINGFDADTDLTGGGRFRALQQLYEAMLAKLGVVLVPARTNMLEFVDPGILKQAFAASVVAPALALGRLFSRFYLPSSYRFTVLGLFPDGSHLMLDHLLSTEAMETVHDGAHLTRVEKTLAISRWPVTFARLRVCFGPTGVRPETGAVANCCACEKCLRTMATLDLAGALGDYACFSKPLDRSLLRRADYRWPGSRIFAAEIVRHARRVGRRDVARDLRRALVRSTLWSWAARVVRAGLAVERRSRLVAVGFRPAKRLIRRLGWGRGWLY